MSLNTEETHIQLLVKTNMEEQDINHPHTHCSLFLFVCLFVFIHLMLSVPITFVGILISHDHVKKETETWIRSQALNNGISLAFTVKLINI